MEDYQIIDSIKLIIDDVQNINYNIQEINNKFTKFIELNDYIILKKSITTEEYEIQFSVIKYHSEEFGINNKIGVISKLNREVKYISNIINLASLGLVIQETNGYDLLY